MSITIELINQEETEALAIKKTVGMAEIQKVVVESFGKISSYLNENGIQIESAPYVAYYNLDMKSMNIEMGFPVSKQLPGNEEIYPVKIPAGKAVTVMYKGAYSGLKTVYVEMFKWINKNKLEPAGVFYDYYYNSPADTPEDELLTKVVIPVKAD